jgi:rhodanese-related sulfurtransferase
VYPAHGPGSSCGKNLGPETFSTIGAQKQTNYALQPQTKDEFVKVVTTGLNPPPAYFPINAKINKEGYDSLDIVLMQSKQALPVATFKNKITEDTIILDTRKAEVFTQGFIPKSIFIGLESRFAEWVGTLIPFDKPILLVTEESQLDETLIRLSRVGYDNVIGYLNGGFAAWQNVGEEIDLIIDVDADELAMDLKFDDNIVIMDVRKEGEFNTGHLVGAKNSPLQEFTNLLAIASIDEQDNVYVHCAGGYRSVIACSLIKKEGVHNIRNIVGGWSKIKDVAELEIVLPSTTLN